jgi:hypothetical protein
MTKPEHPIFKPGRRYRFSGKNARVLIDCLQSTLGVNDGFARFLGAGNPTITVRVAPSGLAKLTATWRYRFGEGTSTLRTKFTGLRLP